jgi:hypothetical protein
MVSSVAWAADTESASFTNPIVSDTDGNWALGGAEDANHNGLRDSAKMNLLSVGAIQQSCFYFFYVCVQLIRVG